jgi:2-dehydropantoate 2-reductase
MRFIVYGAGAIGGVIGARLHQAGNEVVLIARGEHLKAIQRDGLKLEAWEESVKLAIPAVGDPSEIEFRADDVVFLCMKTQDTAEALQRLAWSLSRGLPSSAHKTASRMSGWQSASSPTYTEWSSCCLPRT